MASENGRPARLCTNQCGRGSEPVMVVSSGRCLETVSIDTSLAPAAARPGHKPHARVLASDAGPDAEGCDRHGEHLRSRAAPPAGAAKAALGADGGCALGATGEDDAMRA